MRFAIPDDLLNVLRARRAERQHSRTGDGASQIERLEELRSSSDVDRVAASYVAGMQALQDEVEAAHDAFLLDPGMGPMTYLTADGRVLLDMRTWDGAPLREATDDEAIAALVAGARKTAIAALLELIPPPPADSQTCPMCEGRRWIELGPATLVCLLCGGRGWATAETIARAVGAASEIT